MLRNCSSKLGVSIVGVAIAIAATELPVRAQMITPPAVPENLRVPAGNTPFLKGYAIGTQNYVCLPGPSGLGWTFQGPQATLFVAFPWVNGEIRQQITTHFLSPNVAEAGIPARATWQSSLDTSTVWARKIEESSDPGYVAPGSIPWFLLRAVGTQRGPMGGSMLAQTTFIQRVNTTGGIMPTTGCSQAGSIQFVPYTADYVFYRASGSR
jgi:hypothetical protein